MDRKIMNKIITTKMDLWLASINDKGLQLYLRDKIIVTGGCFVSLLNNEDVNDYDVYLSCREAVIKLADYYVDLKNNGKKNDRFKVVTKERWEEGLEKYRKKRGFSKDEPNGDEPEKGEVDVELEYQDDSKGKFDLDPERVSIYIRSSGVFKDIAKENKTKKGKVKENEFRPVYFTSNAITLSDKVQFVLRFFGDASEIHENYDFVHCTNYWTYNTGVVLNVDALESIINKRLYYRGSKYPITSVVRLRKFIGRGWRIDAGQIVKMCFQISKMDLSDIRVLEDQLIGVDSAYFSWFIEKMKKAEKDPNVIIDNDYIIKTINEVFEESNIEEVPDQEYVANNDIESF